MPRFEKIFPRIPALQDELDKKEIQDKIDPFLAAMSGMESSHGKNLNHKPMTSGIHEGTVAQGQYGLMPNTVDNLTRSQQTTDPMITQLRGLPLEQIVEEAKVNPKLERAYAETLANRVLTNAKGDEELASIGWNQGHNLNEARLQEIAKRKKKYLDRFKRLFQLEPQKEMLAQDEPTEIPET